MKKHQILGLALFAVFAFSAIAAVSASAEGPVWIVLLCLNVGVNLGFFLDNACTLQDTLLEGEFELVLHFLAANEKEAFTSSGGEFKLDGPTNIVCNKEKDTGEIIGGDPGTDLTTVDFEECHVEGLVNCLASTNGVDLIEVTNIQTMLMYPDTSEAPNLAEALDAFFPTPGNLFVKFTILNATGFNECGLLLNGVEVNVNAIGTELAAFGNKKCGVLALVGKLNAANAFELTASGEGALTGAIESSGILEALTLVNGAFALITCKLEAFAVEATELGISDITLNSGNEFGWED